MTSPKAPDNNTINALTLQEAKERAKELSLYYNDHNFSDDRHDYLRSVFKFVLALPDTPSPTSKGVEELFEEKWQEYLNVLRNTPGNLTTQVPWHRATALRFFNEAHSLATRATAAEIANMIESTDEAAAGEKCWDDHQTFYAKKIRDLFLGGGG